MFIQRCDKVGIFRKKKQNQKSTFTVLSKQENNIL